MDLLDEYPEGETMTYPVAKLDIPFNPGVKIDGRNMHPVCEGRNMHPVCEGRNMHHDCEGTLKLMMMTNCILLDKIPKINLYPVGLDPEGVKLMIIPCPGVVLEEIPYPGVILD